MKEMFTLIDTHDQWDKQPATKPAGPREKLPGETD